MIDHDGELTLTCVCAAGNEHIHECGKRLRIGTLRSFGSWPITIEDYKGVITELDLDKKSLKQLKEYLEEITQ